MEENGVKYESLVTHAQDKFGELDGTHAETIKHAQDKFQEIESIRQNFEVQVAQHVKAQEAKMQELVWLQAQAQNGAMNGQSSANANIQFGSYHFGENSVTIKKSDQYLHFDDFESPIELASLLIQEDLVIMHPQDESFYLEAACVCAPTRWSLIDKFQKSLTEIHKEVPGYQERLDGRVKTIFKNLPNNRIFERLNWGIVDDPALFQPVHSKTLVEIENTDPVNLFLRSERQTIRKLTKNRSVIFTIRVHVDSIFSILKNIEHRKDLVESIQNLEEPMK